MIRGLVRPAATFFAMLVVLASLADGRAFEAAASVGEAPDYRYLFLQGRLTEPRTGDPLANAVIALEGPSGTFEAEANERGVFTFERVPVATYDIRVTTSDGRVIRAGRAIEKTSPTRTRIRLKLGRGAGTHLRVEPVTESRVAVTVPEPPPEWNRFWKQGLIFLAVAGALAL
jgi:hypothetical protein